MIVRGCTQDDLPQVQAIYAHHVLTGLATFEEVPPSIGEVCARHERITAGGYPFVVAVRDGRIAGYAYAGEYRPRSAYRFTCESTVYVALDAYRCGIGLALMREVIGACEPAGLRQMLAVIGDSGNTASIGLHTALGFEPVGVFRDVGFKFGRWVDTVLMQLRLGR